MRTPQITAERGTERPANRPLRDTGGDPKRGGPLRRVCLLLTATVQPHTTVHLKRKDSLQRLGDYQRSFRRWAVFKGRLPIVVCENSGFDLTESLSEAGLPPTGNGPVELLSLNASYPGEFGKGYGELLCIDHAVKRSRLITADTLLVKVSGRYFVSNIERLVARVERDAMVSVYCDMLHHSQHCDSRLFIASRTFLAEYLIPLGSCINDTQGVYFEHVLARAVHRALADGLRWRQLPCYPTFNGRRGTNDAPFRQVFSSELVRRVFHYLRDVANL